MSIEIPPDRSIKRRTGKFIRNFVIASVILVGLLLGAGVVYTWLMGQKPEPNVTSVKPKPKPQGNLAKPTLTSPDIRVGVSMQSLTSPLNPGSNASATVHTNSRANCTPEVTFGTEPNKIKSKDSGLVPKAADDYGSATWTWTVEKSAPLGEWTVRVTCANAKHSAVIVEKMKVQKEIVEQ